MRRLAPLLGFAVVACGSETALNIPPDRSILEFTGSTAQDANKAELPAGFTTPDQHQCSADPTRAYLLELFQPGPLDKPQVLWHWAPVVSGPNRDRPTLQQPEFFVAGKVAAAEVSTTDVLADHPFGFDLNVEVSPDPPYSALAYGYLNSTVLHTEVESRAFPADALGFMPQANDRALFRGAWILDCGHPPYFAEMHPPSFIGYARQLDAKTTVAAAVFEPYRSTQLYTQDPSVAVALNSTARFPLIGSKPFSPALIEAIQSAVITNSDHLALHPLMEANRFSSLDFVVCAPNPRPAGAKLSASWSFTARSGVSISADPVDSAGCVRFVAMMGADYTPMPLALQTVPWNWQDLNATATQQAGTPIDVRLAIIAAFPQVQNAPALQQGNPPQVDAYPTLQTLAGASQDSPTAIHPKADTQPFPFYGRVRVAWSP